jgi:beta-lactamase superfamily II metal-dependent hydrolase
VPRPADKDVEIHLFGPGYGESVLVHLGFNEWMIVDSCVGRGSTRPAATEYLESIGVDAASAVKLVVASHWHDDHIRGLAAVVRLCRSAEFFCSSALFDRDFLTLMSAVTDRPMTRSGTGVDEFRAVIDELRARAKASGVRLAGIGLNFAEADKLLWQRKGSVGHPAFVVALSPSSAERLLSLKTLADLVKGIRTSPTTRPQGRVPAVRPNNTAIALHVQVADATLLLGADLEEIGRPPMQDCGWTAIASSTRRPERKSTLFKVAHHGSATAHCEAVWLAMLEPKPVAILTPFRRGSVQLPSKDDATRLRQRTSEAFITAPHASRRAKPSNPVVAREFAATAKAVWEATAMGHIHARMQDGSAERGWQITTAKGAARL